MRMEWDIIRCHQTWLGKPSLNGGLFMAKPIELNRGLSSKAWLITRGYQIWFNPAVGCSTHGILTAKTWDMEPL